MSEPAVKPRYFGEPRNVFDLEEIERRMRESVDTPKQPQEPDPLAELARLVGQTNNDAFSRIFAEQPSLSTQPPALTEPPPVHYPSHDQSYAGHYEQTPQVDYGQHEPAHDGYAAHDPYASYAAAPENPQWQGYYQQEVYAEEPPRRSGRAKLLIGAAVLIAFGGSAGAFMFRGTSGVGRDAPTIMANPGPTKVQPAEQPSDGPKQSISILERNGSTPGGAQSKVVQNEEQPVDVGATARVSGNRAPRAPDAGGPVTLAPPAPPPVANSLFAEPKRVKAVSVRPDGTIIDHSAPTPAPTAPTRAETAAPSTPVAPPVPTGRPNDIASLMASTTPSTTPGSGARTARTPDPKPEPKPTPKPAAPMTTASIPAPTGAGGAFSVQLAGTTSAEEAKDSAERLTRKFASELAGYRPSVIKGEVGSKTVYRVRVRGLSAEDANTLCARLKAGGGSCFVARN